MEPTDTIDPKYKNPTYYGTVVNNPAWQAWEKVAHEYGYDWHESVECGWLSHGHFQAFLDWHKRYKNNYCEII